MSKKKKRLKPTGPLHVLCPYCESLADWVPDSEVYGGRSYGGMVYLCIPCDAYVGCHKQGNHNEPKGFLADPKTREARSRAHKVFDPFWKAAIRERGWSRKYARTKAYEWLSAKLSIPFEQCHIAMMNSYEAERVHELCVEVLQARRSARVQEVA